jgi:porphobilinogen synthase
MSFPVHRPRRLRRSPLIRAMVRETLLNPADFIYPLFIVEGKGARNEIKSMPGIFQLSRELAAAEAKEAFGLGIPAVLLFGIPGEKDAVGTGAYNDAGVVQQAIREIKDACPEIQVITDVCLCEYTDHGHCGVIEGGCVDNDATLPLLSKMAVSHARAGADMVAPSDMMDGRIAAVRAGLDEAGFYDIPIMSYAAKYSSAFYGPFRDAAESAPQFGDRSAYQMDPPNVREALKEVELDIEEGADIVMVKPALAYLDVLYRVRSAVNVPVAAYSVSGEFSMIKAAAANGWLDESRVMMEILTAIKRAGADLVITYFAKEACRVLQG